MERTCVDHRFRVFIIILIDFLPGHSFLEEKKHFHKLHVTNMKRLLFYSQVAIESEKDGASPLTCRPSPPATGSSWPNSGSINVGLASIVFGTILTPALVMIIFGFLCHSTVSYSVQSFSIHGFTEYKKGMSRCVNCTAALECHWHTKGMENVFTKI